jgi:L-threonylcarbamoyladenylate synthase
MNTDFEKDIIQCLEVLKKGGTILYPTDTVWGIGCDATNEAAVEKIFQIKNRPDEKTMIVLVAGERDVLQYVASADPGVFDYLIQNPRPITVVYDGAIGLAQNLVAKDGSIAVRICHEEFCKHLIRRFRKPIVSTSANISGQPTPANFSAIDDNVKNAVDYTVKFRQSDFTPATPSSVIRWRNGQITIIRP